MQTTQKGFIIPLVIIIIAGLGIGGGAYYSQKVKSPVLTTGNPIVEQTQVESQTGASANTMALSQNTNIKIETEEKSATSLGRENIICTKETSHPQGAVTLDTVYADGIMSRTDSKSSYKGGTSMQSILYRDNYFYSWSSLNTTGTKQKITFGSADLSGSTRQSNEAQGYSCRPWIRDASKFEVPTKIHFKDFGSSNLSPISPEIMDIMNETQNNNGYQPSESDYQTIENFFNSQSQ